MKDLASMLQSTNEHKKRSLMAAQQSKLFEPRTSEKSSNVARATDSKTRVEQSQKLDSEPPAFDLQKAIKKMKDDDFFEKEFAKDVRKKQKQKEAIMKQALEIAAKEKELEEAKSLQDPDMP